MENENTNEIKRCDICRGLGAHTREEHQVNLDINPPTSIERENKRLRDGLNLLMNSIADQPEGYFNSPEYADTDTFYRLNLCIIRLKKEANSIYEPAKGAKTSEERLEMIREKSEEQALRIELKDEIKEIKEESKIDAPIQSNQLPVFQSPAEQVITNPPIKIEPGTNQSDENKIPKEIPPIQVTAPMPVFEPIKEESKKPVDVSNSIKEPEILKETKKDKKK